LTEAGEGDGFGRVGPLWVVVGIARARATAVAGGMMRVDGIAAWGPTRPLIAAAVSLVGGAGIISAGHYRCSGHGTVQVCGLKFRDN